MVYYKKYNSAAGDMTLVFTAEAVCGVHFGDVMPEGGECRDTELTRKTVQELDEYFMGKRKNFTLPMTMEGTPFQKNVWNALSHIPYGETRSYQEIADAAGSPKACRAVGMANHNNPLAILIPCHRVVGKDGSLTGYGGGLEMKQFLLDLEKKYSSYSSS